MFYMLGKEIMEHLLRIYLEHIDLGGYYNNKHPMNKLIFIGINLGKIIYYKILNRQIIVKISIIFNIMCKKDKMKKRFNKLILGLKVGHN